MPRLWRLGRRRREGRTTRVLTSESNWDGSMMHLRRPAEDRPRRHLLSRPLRAATYVRTRKPAPPEARSTPASSNTRLVTNPASRIGERLALDRNELPVIPLPMQGQHEHPIGPVIAHFAVGRRITAIRGVTAATRADDELANSVLRVGLAVRFRGANRRSRAHAPTARSPRQRCTGDPRTAAYR